MLCNWVIWPVILESIPSHPLARREIKLEKIFHLLSIGNKPEQLWPLAQLSLLKGQASRWPPVQACAVSWQLEWADSRQHFPFVKACAAIAWSVLWIYKSLAVNDSQRSIFSTLAYSFHCMAAQCKHPQSQQTQIPAPEHQLKLQKPEASFNLASFSYGGGSQHLYYHDCSGGTLPGRHR